MGVGAAICIGLPHIHGFQTWGMCVLEQNRACMYCYCKLVLLQVSPVQNIFNIGDLSLHVMLLLACRVKFRFRIELCYLQQRLSNIQLGIDSGD